MEERVCKTCSVSFALDETDKAFYQKMGVSLPGLCPICRFRRKGVFRNERTLYKRTCGKCDKPVITMYNPESPFLLYCNDCWSSDEWDPYEYGQEYDPGRTFFEQLRELTHKVPKSATYSNADQGPNVNSEYTNFSGSNKNCYLIFNSSPANEDCSYSRGLSNCTNATDAYYADSSEYIYECINAQKCNRVAWGQNISGCIDSYFLLNCSGVQNCFGCTNLRNSSYCFYNVQLSKADWEKQVSEILGSWKKMSEALARFERESLRFPRRQDNNLKSINSSGDYILESKNCRESFEASFCEDSKYLFSIKHAKDCYDLIGHGRQSELLLEGVGVGTSSSVIASWWVENSQDVEYSFATRSSQQCFGCDGIKNGKYTILNKRYSEEEYRTLRDKIVKEMKDQGEYGSFFPPELSFFGYNEGIGKDYLPLTEKEAASYGYSWREISKTEHNITIPSNKLPDALNETDEEILKDVLECSDKRACEHNCTGAFRLIPQEFSLYKNLKVPIPRLCPNCRYSHRLEKRGPLKLWNRRCMCDYRSYENSAKHQHHPEGQCPNEFETPYAPERPETVYCERCYQLEVA